jgi:hypothetical protein
MDWFERITGFRELAYSETQRKLRVEDGRLRSTHSSRLFGVGVLETPSLGELRQRVQAVRGSGPGPSVRSIQGDVRQLHADSAFARAVFQVASQFNLLEMVGPDVTPEHGVSRYAQDFTQGPACAVACGAGTIFRNYLVEVNGGIGQTRERQIDCLADLGAAWGNRQGSLWSMHNGYALCSREGLASIRHMLAQASPQQLDAWRQMLRIGLHRDVEVTDAAAQGQVVTQAYCSALPVAYSGLPAADWRPFAQLVLEAAYESTLLAGVLNRHAGGSPVVLLTLLGGGAFGNDVEWIHEAIRYAVRRVAGHALDVRIVSYGPVPDHLRGLAASLSESG